MLYNPPLISLADIMNVTTLPPLSPFAAVVVMVALWGRCAAHLYAGPASRLGDDLDASTPRDFWARHYELDATTTSYFNSCCSLFAHQGTSTKDSNMLFINLLFQTIIIYLHEAAMAQAKSLSLPFDIAAESGARCQAAAMEIATIVRTLSGSNVHVLNCVNQNPPYMSCSVEI